MIHTLSDNEIVAVFAQNYYGHLGCCTNTDDMYVVPITYAYEEGVLYGFSFAGKKLEMLRKNPRFCFQVQEAINDTKWQSVEAWGTFQELKGEKREKALGLLLDVLWEEAREGSPPYFPFRNSKKTIAAAQKDENIILFGLFIEKQTGRLEVYE